MNRLINIKNKLVKITKSFIWKKIPLFDILRLLWTGFFDGNVTQRAAAASFSIFMAIFPFIIFVFTLLPYLPIEGLHMGIMFFLSELIPSAIYSVIESTLEDILSIKRGGLLSFGVLFALIFATNGIYAYLSAFSISTNVQKKFVRMGISQYINAVFLTILLIISSFLIVAIFLIHTYFMTYLELTLSLTEVIVFWSSIARFVLCFFLIYFNTCLLYYQAQRKDKDWHFFSIGALFSTLSVIAVSYGFQFYMTYFSTYNKLYGSIGVLLAVMLWLYINSTILILGYEINTTIFSLKKKYNKNA